MIYISSQYISDMSVSRSVQTCLDFLLECLVLVLIHSNFSYQYALSLHPYLRMEKCFSLGFSISINLSSILQFNFFENIHFEIYTIVHYRNFVTLTQKQPNLFWYISSMNRFFDGKLFKRLFFQLQRLFCTVLYIFKSFHRTQNRPQRLITLQQKIRKHAFLFFIIYDKVLTCFVFIRFLSLLLFISMVSRTLR